MEKIIKFNEYNRPTVITDISQSTPNGIAGIGVKPMLDLTEYSKLVDQIFSEILEESINNDYICNVYKYLYTLCDDIKVIYIKNKKEIIKTIYNFERNNKRSEYCSEYLYDKYCKK